MNEHPARTIAALAIGALALGALAVGALAIGALAIGRLAVGRATIRRLRVGRLEVDELVVRSETRPSGHRHHHVVCQGCGTVAHLHDEGLLPLTEALLAETGYVLTPDREITIPGLCPRCQATAARSGEQR